MKTGSLSGLINGTEQVVFDYEVGDSFTKLLIHGDGSIVDDVGHSITVSGPTAIDSSNKKIGSGSINFHGTYGDGSINGLKTPTSADWTLGTGDFTIETWFYCNTLPTINGGVYFFNQYTDATNANCYAQFNVNNKFVFYYEDATNRNVLAYYETTNSVNITAGTWNHVAFVRKGTNFYIFVNGVSQTLTTHNAISNNNFLSYNRILVIGAASDNNNPFYSGDYSFDEFRWSKGVARYSSNFTPQLTAFSATGVVSSISTGNILNGDEDGEYTIIGRVIGNGPFNSCVTMLNINGDTGANYGYRGILAGGSNVSDSSSTNLTAAHFISSAYQTGELEFFMVKLYAKSGSVRLLNSIGIDRVSGTYVTELITKGYVWNNTVDNITSLVFNNWQTNGFGVGSRIIVLKSNNSTLGKKIGTITSPYLKGSWVRVGSQVLGAPASSVTFSGLDGNRDVIYNVFLNVKASGTLVSPFIKINNIGGTAYGLQRVYCELSTVYSSRVTDLDAIYLCTSGNTNNYNLNNIFIFAKAGFIRPVISYCGENISGVSVGTIDLMGHSFNDTLSNITSLVISCTSGNFAIGSQLELYALRPNG